ncbi:electron transfer flavoprotein beta subunit [Halanaerobium saccharolyticum]|uniref:Electron transfer flavoprotein small subunit n=1 Tax=Halanaerobium saccharolyticum TaxID=43595 RepID=A0A4R6LMQ1_9FIRM|nr:electron transfer flavoprotein subunit beta/FixA family protein [Halanaerobium saccharolyticum]TDO84350.1 electron transfer flavoprotein beta subunit [Halanaerobium saccharolyticum]
MKIICLVKYVPNVEDIKYDYEENVLIRDNVKLILNPDDAAAVAYSLKAKEVNPDLSIEVLTMGPKSVRPFVEDLLRRNVNKATIISDPAFAGSDTYATSKILASYLKEKEYDCILTGSKSLDGDTAHVPAQLGELLSLNQMSNIISIDQDSFNEKSAIIEVESGDKTLTYRMSFPAILSFRKETGYELPYIKYENMSLDVSDKLNFISNEELQLDEDMIGLKGSLTRVANTYNKNFKEKNKIVVKNDDQGIDYVYSFLKKKGFV